MSRPSRYIVTRPNEPDCGYSCGVGGKDDAKNWAIQNAYRFGGVVYEEFSDGTARVLVDHRDRLPRRPPAGFDKPDDIVSDSMRDLLSEELAPQDVNSR